MPHAYPRARWALPAALLLAPLGAALAQAPVITSIIPMANARAVASTNPVTVTFNQPLTAASAGALKVFSSQRGGLRTRGTTPAVVNGSALGFAPTAYPYVPGETVQYTVTTAAASSGGALARGRVGQFTAAVGGTGIGNFQGGSDSDVGTNAWWETLGDLDGDGDLDLLTANLSGPPATSGTVSMRFNDGTGVFTGTQQVVVGLGTTCVVLGDVDGDGDLDFVSANYAAVNNITSSVSVRLNDGTGTFSGTQNLNIGISSIGGVALGDLDGDGDLDLLATAWYGIVAVRLNNGSGVFSATGQNVLVEGGPGNVVLGDLDNDGDLDFLSTSQETPGRVSVRFNDGTGLFSGTQSVPVTGYSNAIALGDLDGNGDLDFVSANIGALSGGVMTGNGVSVRFNDGSGVFSGTQEVTVGAADDSPGSIVLGDVDNDGDLDFVTANGAFGSIVTGSTVSVRLNNGAGLFTGSREVAVGLRPRSVVLGDVDNDGDLDFVTGNGARPSGSVRLNGNSTLATGTSRPAATFSLFPVPAQGEITLTGTAAYSTFAIFDTLGRVLLTATADATGAARLVLPAGLPAGVYLVRCGGQVRRLAVE